jgi:hypothetical protein
MKLARSAGAAVGLPEAARPPIAPLRPTSGKLTIAIAASGTVPTGGRHEACPKR